MSFVQLGLFHFCCSVEFIVQRLHFFFSVANSFGWFNIMLNVHICEKVCSLEYVFNGFFHRSFFFFLSFTAISLLSNLKLIPELTF